MQLVEYVEKNQKEIKGSPKHPLINFTYLFILLFFFLPILGLYKQPEGSQRVNLQRDFREESEARTVNSTVPESKHIY
jgi:hypothetical protein